tara:strand:- start:219 stop:551 length:333 start_codon:yes stop_codon:yes gene_type:complete
MNPITDIIFTLTWFLLLVWAIRTMSRGWGLSQPVEKVQPPSGVWTTQVKKPVHPEMAEVKPGEQLMGVTFKQKEEDPLQQSLQARINELNNEEDIDDDDEDDGGDVVVRI